MTARFYKEENIFHDDDLAQLSAYQLRECIEPFRRIKFVSLPLMKIDRVSEDKYRLTVQVFFTDKQYVLDDYRKYKKSLENEASTVNADDILY